MHKDSAYSMKDGCTGADWCISAAGRYTSFSEQVLAAKDLSHQQLDWAASGTWLVSVAVVSQSECSCCLFLNGWVFIVNIIFPRLIKFNERQIEKEGKYAG